MSAQEHGCNFCDDFSNKYADISVGSVGSPNGYSTVIVRSEVGEKLLENTQLTTAEVNKDEVVKLSTLKLNRAKKNFTKIIQPEQPIQPSIPTPKAQ